ncbi:hypothetical protein TNCV_1883091 [Trichonephila clavipes]|nr:hypothetical protein TNCV_1883091 [Trichonephila clavipes]
MGKCLAWAIKYKSRTVNDLQKLTFRDETHLFVQEYKSGAVIRSEGETLLPNHFQQNLLRRCVLGLFTTNGIGSLVPLKDKINCVKYAKGFWKLVVSQQARGKNNFKLRKSWGNALRGP